MRYGIREICEVVLKAKSKMTVGNKIFYKNEPVIYFDSLKTSTMEGAATTVYAQGGRGNARLVAWEGERTVTFTMEDALISTLGLAILTGANVIEATNEAPLPVHVMETAKVTLKENNVVDNITLSKKVYEPEDTDAGDYIYVMFLDEAGNIATEPYIYKVATESNTDKKIIAPVRPEEKVPFAAKSAMVDYYTTAGKGTQQVEITPDKFGGNFYLEASTLFRDTNGVDLPAEFIIPNCKVQSNFTFTMASSGDPSTFTFTLDAFPDYTRWDPTKKVLSAIQILGEDDENENLTRQQTDAFVDTNRNGEVDAGEENPSLT